MRNAMTIDVEDYFQVSAFAPYIARAQWAGLPCRIERNIDGILAMLKDNKAKATFFTLGWIARRYPGMIHRIVAEGHELASHGYAHKRVTEQSNVQFLRDIRCSKHLLEDLSGQPIHGYRAPSFSLPLGDRAARMALRQAGYRYSSSIYPVQHDHYGAPDAPRFAFGNSEEVLEIPISTVRLGRTNVPAGGGGYFRLYPYALSRALLRRLNVREQQASIFYFHPWELDAGQPNVPDLDMKTRFRHYLNLDNMAARLGCLMRDFRWDRIDQVFHIAP